MHDIFWSNENSLCLSSKVKQRQVTTLVSQQRLAAWILHCASMDKTFLYGLEVQQRPFLLAQSPGSVIFQLYSSYEFWSLTSDTLLRYTGCQWHGYGSGEGGVRAAFVRRDQGLP